MLAGRPYHIDPEVNHGIPETICALGMVVLSEDSICELQPGENLHLSDYGTKFVVEGRIQTGSYTNKDGQKVYTTDVVVENAEFAESKSAASGNAGGFAPADRPAPSQAAGDGFMNIPDGIDEELPFN